MRNDAPAIASVMTDNWVYAGANGITSKADIIDRIEPPKHRSTPAP